MRKIRKKKRQAVVGRAQRDAVTAKLNEVYARVPAKVDAGLHAAQLRSIERESW